MINFIVIKCYNDSYINFIVSFFQAKIKICFLPKYKQQKNAAIDNLSTPYQDFQSNYIVCQTSPNRCLVSAFVILM